MLLTFKIVINLILNLKARGVKLYIHLVLPNTFLTMINNNNNNSGNSIIVTLTNKGNSYYEPERWLYRMVAIFLLFLLFYIS